MHAPTGSAANTRLTAVASRTTDTRRPSTERSSGGADIAFAFCGFHPRGRYFLRVTPAGKLPTQLTVTTGEPPAAVSVPRKPSAIRIASSMSVSTIMDSGTVLITSPLTKI